MITLAEHGDPAISRVMGDLYRHGGQARVIGVTGPPGAGKSTLIDHLVTHYRAQGKSIAVLAVDPSSPGGGGALLGDRIRMARHSLDQQVYIRSMATRGRLGGLAAATGDAVTVLDAAGFEYIFLETVGVGQNELAVADYADLLVVLQTAHSGDRIQTMKAGLAELGDLLVVTKADSPGTADMLRVLRDMAHDRRLADEQWPPEVCAVEAETGVGVDELATAMDRFFAHITQFPAAHCERQRRRARRSVEEIISRRLAELYPVEANGSFEDAIDAVVARMADPHTLAEEILVRTQAAKIP